MKLSVEAKIILKIAFWLARKKKRRAFTATLWQRKSDEAHKPIDFFN